MKRKGTYRNPVQRGDYPDPSLIRVGERDFWATTTSTEWAPHFPLLNSRDLIHWEHVDAVFARRPDWATGSFWAPEISYHNGRYYVYYVAQHASGELTVAVATAERPQGPYVDRGPLVGQAAGSIDPTAVTGEDGRRYLIWKEDGNARNVPTIIWLQPLTADGLRLDGQPFPILRNDAPWEGHVVEGPSVIERGRYFYLFYSGNSCCGKRCKYAVGVARATSIMGPWEKYSGNPIIPGNRAWRCPGHGSIVDTADGRTFYLYHAYSRTDSIYVGRQVLLDEVSWTDDGWPRVNKGLGPSTESPLPFEPSHHFRIRARRWQWPQATSPVITMRGGLRREVTLAAGASDSSLDVLASTIGRPIECSRYVARVTVSVKSLAKGVQASLAAYGDEDNAVGIGVRDGALVVFRRSRGVHRTLAQESITGGSVTLRMIADSFEYRFYYRRGLRWISLGPVIRAPHLTPWDRGVRAALCAGGAANASAKFARFRIERTAAMPERAPFWRAAFAP